MDVGKNYKIRHTQLGDVSVRVLAIDKEHVEVFVEAADKDSAQKTGLKLRHIIAYEEVKD